MHVVIEVTLWFFLGSILVLIVTHAPGFAEFVGGVGTPITDLGKILAGY